MSKLKLLVIGPCRSGKTTLSNLLAEFSETPSAEYQPTAGCRILEFDREVSRNSSRPLEGKIGVELWDVSGDQKYEKCWPAIMKSAQAVVLVYNPGNPQQEAEIEQWYQMFPRSLNIPNGNVIVFAHYPNPGSTRLGKARAPRVLQTLNYVETSMENPDAIRSDFIRFLGQVMSAQLERQEKEELSLIS
eukprot:GILI01014920.1.p2 GENE.GILI01014920.1~~GILI01014920.1.p2  ORF type:complete len:203 (-),score=50.03 GILI01014920.1:1161-1727(-)